MRKAIYSKTVRKYLVILLALGWVITLIYFLPSLNKGRSKKTECIIKVAQPEGALINDAFILLKCRQNYAALAIFDKVLASEPENLDALWGRAEILRRTRDFKTSEQLLNGVLKKNPGHISSLISLSYIRYKDDKLDEAQQLLNLVLKNKCSDRENEALAYMMLGTINSRRSAKSWVFNKIRYGTRIKSFFLKAGELAPGLSEVHLGLGTFYLLAPAIAGGDTSKAVEELELAVKIAPTFATANARLAQGYRKKGDLEKYNFYRQRAKEFDPGDEAVKENE